MSDLNSIFNEFARAFVGTVTDGNEVAHANLLDREQLDGSLDSLHVVDAYLSALHSRRDTIGEREWHLTVLRAGAYVGEVIRHSAPAGAFNWVDYDEYLPAHPNLRDLLPERNSATCAFLVHRTGAMSLPLNKIARYIAEGAEHSVHFFASCDLRREGVV